MFHVEHAVCHNWDRSHLGPATVGAQARDPLAQAPVGGDDQDALPGKGIPYDLHDGVVPVGGGGDTETPGSGAAPRAAPSTTAVSRGNHRSRCGSRPGTVAQPAGVEGVDLGDQLGGGPGAVLPPSVFGPGTHDVGDVEDDQRGGERQADLRPGLGEAGMELLGGDLRGGEPAQFDALAVGREPRPAAPEASAITVSKDQPPWSSR